MEATMITPRYAEQRGRVNLGWLDSRHSFSFGDYFDPAHMGFGALRVINEDHVAPGAGFPEHPHRDMEIITYVLSGAVEHRDSMGNVETVRPGEVQRMTAGTGVRHSEYNPSPREPLHLLQIWLLPDRAGHRPGYEQRAFPSDGRHGELRLVASPDGAGGSLSVHQDARLYAAVLDEGQSVTHPLADGRRAWVQVARGAVTVNGETLYAGDGAAIEQEASVTVAALSGAEVLLFDLE
jgi:redox-sensitive bicupin YhaK (pirin superfamily)